jgi:predicted transcriptional regulator
MDYTQFPLYDGEKFMGLLSENGITKWLAKNVEDGIFDGDTLLSDVISFEEEENNFSFINREASIYEAKEAFRNYIDKGLELDALLITHSGSAHEKLMGIITRWDIITIQ